MGGLAIAAVLGGAGAAPSRLQRLNLNSNLLSAETQRALADALRDTSSECVCLGGGGCQPSCVAVPAAACGSTPVT